MQKSIEPLQDSILATVKLVAAVSVEGQAGWAAVLEGMRATDKQLRARLLVLQVARKYSWEHAIRLARTKAGDYLDPDLNKVMEYMEKKEEKAKREREKEVFKRRSDDSAKRSRFNNYRGGQSYSGYRGTGQSTSRSQSYGQSYGQGYGYRAAGGPRPRPTDEEKKCHNCNEKGHYWRACPIKK